MKQEDTISSGETKLPCFLFNAAVIGRVQIARNPT